MNEFVGQAQRTRIFPDGIILPGTATASIGGALSVGGAIVRPATYKGTVSVASNAVVATVSTAAVSSDSNITANLLTSTGSAVGAAVGSRVDGVSFAVTIVADATLQHTVGWEILS